MPDAPDNKRLVHRKDAEGKTQTGQTWETLIDRQIREAMEEGKFDDLPHKGAPLPNDENPYAGDKALAFHMLRNAGVAPPWIEADKHVRELLAKRDEIIARVSSGPPPTTIARRRDHAALEELITQINVAVARVNAEAPATTISRRPLVLADELARYDAASRRPPKDR